MDKVVPSVEGRCRHYDGAMIAILAFCLWRARALLRRLSKRV
jgi:hypothetical protein